MTVEGEPHRAGVVHGHLVPAGDLRAGAGGHHVVGADLDALLREQLGDVVGEGVQRACLAVDVQLDRLVLGDERRGAARQEGDDQGLREQPPHGTVRALGVPRLAPARGPAVRAGARRGACSGPRPGRARLGQRLVAGSALPGEFGQGRHLVGGPVRVPVGLWCPGSPWFPGSPRRPVPEHLGAVRIGGRRVETAVHGVRAGRAGVGRAVDLVRLVLRVAHADTLQGPEGVQRGPDRAPRT